MASVERERPENGGADPYDATVERLFALLEENQIAITALAQAWRHTRRDLELTKVQLEAAERRLAAEALVHRKAAG